VSCRFGLIISIRNGSKPAEGIAHAPLQVS